MKTLRQLIDQAPKIKQNVDHVMYKGAIDMFDSILSPKFLDIPLISEAKDEQLILQIPYIHDHRLDERQQKDCIDLLVVQDRAGNDLFWISWYYRGDQEGAFYAQWMDEGQSKHSKRVMYRDKSDGYWKTNIENIREITLSQFIKQLTT